MPSSVVRRFDYDAAQEVLDVTFVSGRRYRFFGVPLAIAERFRRSTSKGRFFNARIRERNTFTELEAASE